MAGQPNWMLIKFDQLMENYLPNIKFIAWDLDGTLGLQPGWRGYGDILTYIIDYPLLRETMRHLTNRFGIGHILVSRNGMFCGDNYETMEKRLTDLGFHGILPCYNIKRHSKVQEFYKQTPEGEIIPPNNVLLIDDQQRECEMAQAEGAYALHIKTFIQKAILDESMYTLYVPHE